jgi:hypothetical protein
MASGGERRMLFDIRGRRKHVIRVVYAILALLMALSLFLVVGPVNVGSLIGNSASTSNSTKIFDERAERLERKLRKTPNDEALQLALIRTRISGGRAAAETDPTTGQSTFGPEARAEFEDATEAWDRYAKQAGKEASPSTAQLVAQTWIVLAENPAAGFEEAFESLEEAARVQGLYAEARPSASSYTTLALFQLISGDFKQGEKSGKKAERLATSKVQRKQVQKALKSARKQGKQNLKTKKEIEKAEKGKGKEQLENPLGGFGGSTSLPGG